jgi:tetratricopeptide (TPR) repeat protein
MKDLDHLAKPISYSSTDYVQMGDRYVDNLPIAINYYQQAIDLDPAFVLAYERLGTIYQLQNQPMEAIVNFSKAIAINPSSLTAQLGLGNAYQQMGWQELAITHWQIAFALAPDRFFAEDHCRLGDQFAHRGRIAEAIQIYEQAIAIAPTQPIGYRAILRLQQQIAPDPAAMEKIFERAITANPHIWTAQDYNLMAVLWMQKSHSSINPYDTAPPENADHTILNSQQLKTSYLDKAIAYLETAIQIEPSYADAHCNLGSAYLHQGRSQDAILAYKEAIDIDPNFPQPYLNLGIHLSNIGKIAEAIACLESAIALEPQSLTAKIHLSKILAHQVIK